MIEGTMLTSLWQDVVVTIAALAGIALIAWRVFGFFGTGESAPRCANCQPNDGACATTARPNAAGNAGTTHPAVFIRQPR
jgi:hypothetical protein